MTGDRENSRGPESIEGDNHDAELKKIRELIKLFLNLRKRGVKDNGQLARVEEHLLALLEIRKKRIVKIMETVFNKQNPLSNLDLTKPEDGKIFAQKWGFDPTRDFPYSIDLKTEEGLQALFRHFREGGEGE